MGFAAEVADVVAFLLSDQSRFVTGAIIPVDGGRSAVGRDPEEAGPEEAGPKEAGPEEAGPEEADPTEAEDSTSLPPIR